jgi:hypothetical protein
MVAQSKAPITAVATEKFRLHAKVTAATGNVPMIPNVDPEAIAKATFGPESGQLRAVPIPNRKVQIVAPSVPMTATTKAQTNLVGAL